MNSESSKPTKKHFSVWKLFGILFCVIITSIVLVSTYLRSQYRERIQEHIASLKADGYPVTLEDLQPELLADENNSAIYLRPLFVTYCGDTGLLQDPEIDKAIEDLLSTAVVLSDEERSKAASTLQQFLDNHRKDIDNLRNFLDMPQCLFPVRYEESYNISMPHCMHSRQIAKLMCAASATCQTSAQWDLAVRYAVSAARLHSIFSDDHTLISQLVRWVVLDLALTQYRSLLTAWDDIPATHLQDLLDALPAPDELPDMVDVLSWERVFSIHEFSQSRFPNNPFYQKSAIKELDFLKMLSVYEEWLKSIRDIRYVDRLGSGMIEKILDELPPYCILTRYVLPALSNVENGYENLMTKLKIMRLVLRLELHKRANGNYPDSLQTIPGNWINDYDEKPITYVRTDTGFTLEAESPDGLIQWPEPDEDDSND